MTVLLKNEDIRETLRSMLPESVDCIITDPPYRTISGGNSIGKNGPGTYGRPTGILLKNDGKVFEHNDIKFEEYMAGLYRVLSSPGHMWIFTNEMNRRRMEDVILDTGFKIHMLGGWVKNTCNPNRWGMKNCELFFLCRKGRAKSVWTPGLKQFIHHDNIAGRKKFHPTEKPFALMSDMVRASTLEGQTVFDPFMGSGTTGVAAKHLKRNFVGVELDPAHFTTAQVRINGMPS